MPLKCPLLSTFLPCPPSPWIRGPSVVLAPAWCLEARAAFAAGQVRLATANGNEEVTAGARGGVCRPGCTLRCTYFYSTGQPLRPTEPLIVPVCCRFTWLWLISSFLIQPT